MRTFFQNMMRYGLRGLLVAAILSVGTTVARAQNAFTVDLNANAGILAGGPNAGMNAVRNTQLALLMDFNSVALRVSNDASSTSNLTQFALSIGDERFNFANFPDVNDLIMPGESIYGVTSVVNSNPMIIPSTGISALTTTNTATPQQVVAGDDNANRIVVDFGNGGIEPGYSAIFEVRFEFDDSIPIEDRPRSEPVLGIGNSSFPQYYPSYHRILFDIDGLNPTSFSDGVDLVDLSDNGAATISFGDGTQAGPMSLADRVDVGPAFARDVDARHPAPPFITQPLSGVVGIPEPTTLALLLMGLARIATRRRRFR